MTPSPSTRALTGFAERARGLAARAGRGVTEAHRSLPIHRSAPEIVALWADAPARTAVLAGLPKADATVTTGADQGDWGVTTTLTLRLAAPLPRVQAQALAGKAVRRLKSLAETGEVPTTERNPSYRADAGQEAVA
jgi:hypothetical protein